MNSWIIAIQMIAYCSANFIPIRNSFTIVEFYKMTLDFKAIAWVVYLVGMWTILVVFLNCYQLQLFEWLLTFLSDLFWF